MKIKRNYKILIALSIWLMPTWAGAQSDKARMRADDIRLFGNEKIKSYVIARELPFKRGEYFSSEDLRIAKEKIRAIPGIDYAEIMVSYVPRDSSNVVMVVVTEKQTLHGYLLVERGYENKLSFGLKAMDDNFRGRGEKLYALGLFRGNTIFEAGWQNPWVLGEAHLGIGFKAFYEKYTYIYADLGTAAEGAEIQRAGISMYVSHSLGEHQNLSLTSGFESVKSSKYGITVSNKEDRYLSLGLNFVRETRGNSVFPWNASYAELGVRRIGLGNKELSILETRADLRKYIGLFSRIVIAFQGLAQLRAGDSIPAYRREHIGGASTLEGYDYGTFHGVNMALTTWELRIPVNFSQEESVEDVLFGLSMQLFAESAAAWENDEKFKSESFHSSFGVGLSILTKNATGLRFDYAWNPRSSGRWEIDAGLKF